MTQDLILTLKRVMVFDNSHNTPFDNTETRAVKLFIETIGAKCYTETGSVKFYIERGAHFYTETRGEKLFHAKTTEVKVYTEAKGVKRGPLIPKKQSIACREVSHTCTHCGPIYSYTVDTQNRTMTQHAS